MKEIEAARAAAQKAEYDQKKEYYKKKYGGKAS